MGELELPLFVVHHDVESIERYLLACGELVVGESPVPELRGKGVKPCVRGKCSQPAENACRRRLRMVRSTPYARPKTRLAPDAGVENDRTARSLDFRIRPQAEAVD